ncbi:YxiJ family protein [Heyndrickxia sporothermodurans]
MSEPFPYEDSRKLRNDFSKSFSELSEELSFNADFNMFSMNIDGCIDYIVSGKIIPNNQLKILSQSFFEFFPEYLFLKEHLCNYPDLYKELKNFEYARNLIIEYVKSKN